MFVDERLDLRRRRERRLVEPQTVWKRSFRKQKLWKRKRGHRLELLRGHPSRQRRDVLAAESFLKQRSKRVHVLLHVHVLRAPKRISQSLKMITITSRDAPSPPSIPRRRKILASRRLLKSRKPPAPPQTFHPRHPAPSGSLVPVGDRDGV